MPYIKTARIWTDDDEMIQLDVCASNDSQVTTQDFYIYPKDLLKFGDALQHFPKNKDDIIDVEYGIEPNYCCYFLLRAVVLDAVGHTAFELKTNNRLDPPIKAECHFYLPCEAATINKFGSKLVEWSNDMSKTFNYEWENL